MRPLKTGLIGCATLLGLTGIVSSVAAQSAAQSGAVPKVISAQPTKPAVPAPQPKAEPDLRRADFIRLMDAEFRRRDVDGDGRATRIEVQEFTKRAATVKAQEQNRALFQRLDTDRNGILSPTEFAGLIPAPGFIDVSAEMARFDNNRDQVITLVEYRTATLSNFDRTDADKDGILTIVELSKMNAPANIEPLVR